MAPHRCHGGAAHHHHHHHPYPSSSSSCCCCCSCSTVCHCSSTAACQPLPSVTDPLLQCLAAHLLQSVDHLPPPPQHHQNQYQFHHLPQKHPQPKPYHQRRQSRTDSPEERAYVDSLIQRIASLESSLVASPPPPRPRAPQKGASTTARVSLRDIAARTIQTQFRLYLVRRSRTLRHLQDLAIVRSHVADLKSLVPTSASVSQRAMDLLLHLDSIQGQDQMIREGKKTIAEDLVRILEVSCDGLSAKRREQHSKPLVKIRGGFSGGGDEKVPSSNSSSDVGKEEEGEEEEVIYEGGSSRVSEDDGGVCVEEQRKGGVESFAGLGNRRNGMLGVGSSSSSSSLGRQKWVPQLGLYAPLPVQMDSTRTEPS